MEQRTKYRGILKTVDENKTIQGIELNIIDPSASKRCYQNTLRHDKQYIVLLTQYRDIAKELYKKSKSKSVKSSKRVRILQSKIIELQKKIKDRESEIRRSSIVYAIVPASDYISMDETEAEETVSLLKKKSVDELLTAEKKIIGRVTT